jgi:hypothetical protein
MNTLQQEETKAILRMAEKIKELEEQLDVAKRRIAVLEGRKPMAGDSND